MINLIGSLITDAVGFFRDKQKAEHNVDLAVLKNRQRLAEDRQANNKDWEVHQLQNGDRWLRRISFLLFSLPLILTVVRPDIGAQIFINLEKAPDWYVQTFISINGAVWAIVELKHAAPQFINGIKSVLSKSDSQKK